MSKVKFDIGTFTDGSYVTDIVAAKSVYGSKEEFLGACAAEEFTEQWPDEVQIENVSEAHCRYYPTGFEGWNGDGGCYGFCRPGPGSFPVWYISIR